MSSEQKNDTDLSSGAAREMGGFTWIHGTLIALIAVIGLGGGYLAYVAMLEESSLEECFPPADDNESIFSGIE
ncbi:hypothetical protein Pla163_24090 [Planctomycetes bacterium Pla163]|uniref:Uncharacterized protein n=1 Tax=Rohdeia mirabilis TaxID=2528008 RepID=A0A518D1C2_9BACT|nr:hypothetical protein Pla163_24090 [Planctomycetes bacterium Pla163]